MYTWILVAGAINSFLDAGGIGANDLGFTFDSPSTFYVWVSSLFSITK